MGENKLIIIGLDGATWNILNPLIEMGKLPTIKRLVVHGISCELESTFPPVTGPAWLSIATGKNPGKTGVYDFFNKNDDNLNMSVMTSGNFFTKKAFWDYLSDSGKKVGIFNYPLLNPAYPVNGFMIGGFNVTRMSSFTYPSNLLKELDDIVGGYDPEYPDYHRKYYKGREEIYLCDLEKSLEMRIKCAIHLIQNKDWDVLMMVLNETDLIQHYMWKHWDENHPNNQGRRSKKLRTLFIDFYRKLDNGLGQLIENAGKETNIILLSDHGLGPLRYVFYLNRWLQKNGYLSIYITGYIKRFIKEQIERLTPDLLLRRLLAVRQHLQTRKGHYRPRHPVLSMIQKSSIKAVSLSFNRNVGIIFLADSYKNLRDEIIKGLIDLNERLPFQIEIRRPEEIYEGNLENAPDILVNIKGFEGSVISTHIPFRTFKRGLFSLNQSAIHRMNGIFTAYGPDFNSGLRLKGLKIYDIAPIILYNLGFLAPSDMDGAIPKKIFTEQFEKSHPKLEVKLVKQTDMPEACDESNETIQKLQGLGYI